MSFDLFSFASLVGSPVGYIVVGFALYKVYNRVLQTEKYARRANHNSTVLVKAFIRHDLIDEETIKELELDGE